MIGIALVLSLLASPPLVVHEWGTFTTMQGSSGVDLDGMQHETERLPAFVHSRTDSQQSPFRDFGDTSYDETIRHQGRMGNVRGKMETPVIYFYTDAAQRVLVHVDFVGGLLTQWYPRASATEPAFTAGSRLETDLARVSRSSLDWELDLVPFAQGAPASMPRVSAGDSWELARDVRAASVRTTTRPASTATAGPEESDRYIFYRGLGRMEQTLSVEAFANGVAIVRNQTADRVVAAFALDMGETDGRFERLGPLEAGVTSAVMMGNHAAPAPRQPKAQVVASLEAAVHAVLVEQGLFADEATAMVRTWSPTWFGAEGTRVVYLFPRPRIDRLIPLTIAPVPDQLVRVMVGRLEYLTPESEQALAGLLRDRMSPDPRVVAAANARLARRGRFLEASVRRIAAITRDPLVKSGAASVLADY